MTTPLLLAIISGVILLLMGAFAVAATLMRDNKNKRNATRRLSIDNKQTDTSQNAADAEDEPGMSGPTSKAAEHALALATGGDKEKTARIRKMLIRSGEFDPAATGKFVLKRFAMMGCGIALALLYMYFTKLSLLTPKGVAVLGFFAILGYFIPSVILFKKTKDRVLEYRNGFPDFMDLMIVCADAGLSMEASVDRVSRELATTYPYLSHNLTVFSLELRAGRNIHDAMKAFGDRVGLEEVDAFAVLLKQSKELGTSLASTLRVFSEEMRDKRMMAAEEKAHALPAKMTIPVTMCILPTVVMIAIIPIIVTLGGE